MWNAKTVAVSKFASDSNACNRKVRAEKIIKMYNDVERKRQMIWKIIGGMHYFIPGTYAVSTHTHKYTNSTLMAKRFAYDIRTTVYLTLSFSFLIKINNSKGTANNQTNKLK